MSPEDTVSRSIITRRKDAVSTVTSEFPQPGLPFLSAQSLYSPWSATVIAASTSAAVIEAVAVSEVSCFVKWYLVPQS